MEAGRKFPLDKEPEKIMDFIHNEARMLPAPLGTTALDIHPTAGPATDRPAPEPKLVAIIDRRTLGREALTRALAAADSGLRSLAFVDAGEWELSLAKADTSVILLQCGAASPGDELHALIEAYPRIPVVVMGESEDPRHIAGILAQGARGYIPTSVSLSVAVGALGLAIAGGSFVPACALRSDGVQSPERGPSVHDMLGLSERQAAVADAVALGKPNKIIAYELDLCESTVKVHIRSIMKKLQARNRTEIAFKLHAAKNRAA
jgi:DNA-binding NarL/FixJ family response regulator